VTVVGHGTTAGRLLACRELGLGDASRLPWGDRGLRAPRRMASPIRWVMPSMDSWPGNASNSPAPSTRSPVSNRLTTMARSDHPRGSWLARAIRAKTSSSASTSRRWNSVLPDRGGWRRGRRVLREDSQPERRREHERLRACRPAPPGVAQVLPPTEVAERLPAAVIRPLPSSAWPTTCAARSTSPTSPMWRP
jgi:hypothetical protein